MNQSKVKIKIEKNDSNLFLISSVEGQVKTIELPEVSIYVLGTIHHKWFYEDSKCREILNGNIWNKTFYNELEGHYSILIVSAKEKRLRLVTNRVGGSRLYINSTEDQLIVANSLEGAITGQNYWNPIASKETLEYRWTSDRYSLIDGIQQIPPGNCWEFSNNQTLDRICTYHYPGNTETHADSIEGHASQVESLLGSAIESSIRPATKVGVLLSGGVDSSILSALTQQRKENVIAISHRSDDHLNQELQTAITFARELGIEHRIITVNDETIRESFITTTQITGQPPRYQSSLILNKIFQSLSGEIDQIIYGEAADTLFGSSLINNFRKRILKQNKLNNVTKLIPFSKALIDKLPQHNKFRSLQNENVAHFMLDIGRLHLSSAAEKFLANLFTGLDSKVFIDRLNVSPAEYSDIELLKTHIMQTDCENHFHETFSLAQTYGIDIISPFVNKAVVDYAWILDEQAYFGKDSIKPVLRKIGEKYFTSELMYLPKKGFPAPHTVWLDTVLDDLWQDARGNFGLTSSDYDSDTEFKWTVAALGVLESYFSVPFKLNL